VVLVGVGAELRGDRPRLLRVGIDDTDQLHVRHVRQDAGVVLSQVADADDRHPQTSHKPTVESRKVEGRKVEAVGRAHRQAAGRTDFTTLRLGAFRPLAVAASASTRANSTFSACPDR
jgi:hypothetical protein